MNYSIKTILLSISYSYITNKSKFESRCRAKDDNFKTKKGNFYNVNVTYRYNTYFIQLNQKKIFFEFKSNIWEIADLLIKQFKYIIYSNLAYQWWFVCLKLCISDPPFILLNNINMSDKLCTINAKNMITTKIDPCFYIKNCWILHRLFASKWNSNITYKYLVIK